MLGRAVSPAACCCRSITRLYQVWGGESPEATATDPGRTGLLGSPSLPSLRPAGASRKARFRQARHPQGHTVCCKEQASASRDIDEWTLHNIVCRLVCAARTASPAASWPITACGRQLAVWARGPASKEQAGCQVRLGEALDQYYANVAVLCSGEHAFTCAQGWNS